MKGISTVVASLLVLVLLVAMAGIAFMFISGAFTGQVQGVEIVDGYCQEGATDVSTIIIRNAGTEAITNAGTSMDVDQTSPSGAGLNVVWNPTDIDPGVLSTMTDGCEGSGPRTCIYRITPPTGRTVTASVRCT